MARGGLRMLQTLQQRDLRLLLHLFYLRLRSGPPVTGLTKPKSPKVPGRVLGSVPVKRGLLGVAGNNAFPLLFLTQPSSQHCSQHSPPFPGTLPITLPSTFGDLGFVSPVADGPLSDLQVTISLLLTIVAEIIAELIRFEPEVCIYSGNLIRNQ